MAISSIHIEGGSGGYFGHNSREAHTNNSIFNDEENYCSASKEEAFKLFREELKTRTQAYESRTGQKLQKNSTTHLSAIFNFNYETAPEQAHKVCEYLEKTLDTKVVQMSMHRDEGHIVEEESKSIHDKIKVNTSIKNYHGHIEMLGLDSQGNSIRRKLDKPMLREIQTEVAKILQMERGRHTSYNKEEYLKITNELKPQNSYADKKEYNKAFNEKAKELGILKERKAKRLDTYPFKKAKEMEATKVKELLATKEQLKTANNQLREFMKSNGANRNDYAELEKEKKHLEEQLKAKLLTEKELLTKFQTLEKNFISSKSLINELKTEKEVLASKVTDLEDKINSRANMTAPQPPKDIQEEFNKIKKEELEEKEVKTGLFSSEKIKVLKSDSNILQRTWNIVSSKYNDLVKQYDSLVDKFKALQKENLQLKEKVRALESEAPKQKEVLKPEIQKIVEQAKEINNNKLQIKDILDGKKGLIESFKEAQLAMKEKETTENTSSQALEAKTVSQERSSNLEKEEQKREIRRSR